MWCVEREEREEKQNESGYKLATVEDVYEAIHGMMKYGKEQIIKDKIEEEPKTKSYNIGNSDYSKHKIQPWDIWKEYQLDPWRADIIKRILRNKSQEDRKLDLQKIIHICEYLLEVKNGENV